jgi:glycerol kinase
MATYIGALDQGTTSTRFIIFDRGGRPVATAAAPHRQHHPRSGWVEHDAEEIWAAAQGVIAQALRTAALPASAIASLGITNQRETLVVWNRDTGAPYHRALVWQDQRGAALCAELAAAHPALGENRFRAATGLPLIPYFTASKLAWLLDSVPGLRADAEAGRALAGTMDSFLVWRLTRSSSSGGGGGGAQHLTDVTNASRTLLFNIHSLAWDEELLRAFGVPRAMLPRVTPSSGRLAVCAPDSCLPAVPIGGILGDQQAALFGQACFAPGDAKNTYGTGCFLLMNTGAQPRSLPSSKLLTTIAYQLGSAPPVYALEGSVAVAGAAVSWLKDNLGLVASAQELEALAGSVPDSGAFGARHWGRAPRCAPFLGFTHSLTLLPPPHARTHALTHTHTRARPGGAVFVPAFNGLYAPYWRTDARGVLVGLSGNVGRAQIARATLEAVAHQSRQLLETMDAEARQHAAASGAAPAAGAAAAGSSGAELKVDGGMTANAMLMQFQADVTGRRVVRPMVAETTALGAAYAAGLAVGYWRDTAELASHWKMSQSWAPSLPAEAVAASCTHWERAVARSLNWHMPEASVAELRRDPALALLQQQQQQHVGGAGAAAARSRAAAAAAAAAAGPRQGSLLPGLNFAGRTRMGRATAVVGALGLLSLALGAGTL